MANGHNVGVGITKVSLRILVGTPSVETFVYTGLKIDENTQFC